MKNAEEFALELSRYSRKCTALLMLLSAAVIPTILGFYYHAFPTIQQFAASAGPLILITAPSAISEILAYTPILGSGSYLAFSTGNLMTMRVSSQMNAVAISGSQPNTEEYDLLSTYAVSISVAVSVGTMMIIALLVTPLSPFLSSPVISDATRYILPALFGSMLYNSLFSKGKGVHVTRQWMIFLIPFALIMLLILWTGPLGQRLGFVMLGALPVTLLTAYIFYRMGWVRLEET